MLIQIILEICGSCTGHIAVLYRSQSSAVSFCFCFSIKQLIDSQHCSFRLHVAEQSDMTVHTLERIFAMKRISACSCPSIPRRASAISAILSANARVFCVQLKYQNTISSSSASEPGTAGWELTPANCSNLARCEFKKLVT